MDILDRTVTHRELGTGRIERVHHGYISVAFGAVHKDYTVDDFARDFDADDELLTELRRALGADRYNDMLRRGGRGR